MVICKYFQQGNCRFGQYCRFEHIGTFAAGAQATVNKTYGDGKSIVLGVAEEVLAAERGGQWLLSCFGPFKEQACIPGMEDISPEEVRWEIYQAQKNGTVDQTKLQLQQLCRAMTIKREALKNPTHETADMLEKLQKVQQDSSFPPQSNFILSTPQLGGGSISGNGIFTSKTFATGSSGSFGDNANHTSISQTSSNIFSRPNTNGTSSFGGGFGAASTFGAFVAPQVTSNNIFGGGTKSQSSIFANSQTMPSGFGSTPSATATPPTPVSQTNTLAFSTPNNQNLFSTNQQQKTSIFPTSQSSQGASIFGGGIFSGTSTSIFGNSKNTVAFGSTPTFGVSGGGLGGATTSTIFGNQGTFTNSASPFAQATIQQTSSFGATTNSFGTLATSSSSNFTSAANNTLSFGNDNNPLNLSDNASLGKLTSVSSGITVGQPFAATATTLDNSLSGVSKTNVSTPFGNTIDPPEKFSDNTSGPFISTTTSLAANNPFITKSQLPGDSFVPSPFCGSTNDESTLNEMNTIYSTNENLSDNDKKMFLAGTFILSKIPITPPTIELR